MSESRVEDPIPPASVTGRIGKVLIGGVQVWFSWVAIVNFDGLTRPSLHQSMWIFAAAAFWLLPFDINLGFHRVLRLGRKPLFVAVAMAGLGAAIDWLRTGVAWGAGVAGVVLAVTIFTHTHMGVSHLLAAVSGIRGCEMRVIPYWIARLRGGAAEAELYLCPGVWTPIDRWEARLRGQTA